MLAVIRLYLEQTTSAERRPKISPWIFIALGYLKEKYAYFLPLACYYMVTALPANVSVSQMKPNAQSPPRCSVALSNSTLVWSLAGSQSVHSDSGPAVRFFLWITVHSPELIPVQNGFTGAGRKQFIALTSLLKIWTNCKLRLSHVDVKEKQSRPHTSQLQDVCQPVCV